MMKSSTLKMIGIVLVIVLILNVFLFAFRVINWIVFWIIIALGAVFVYFILPKLKKNIT